MNNLYFELDNNGIAVLKFDSSQSSSNKLSQGDIAWMNEFLNNIERQLDIIENEDEIRAVVLYSDKENSFLNGANISKYLEFTLADEGRVYSLKAQELTEKIESSRAPFIAAIDGACLGIGFEIALACEYRIASQRPQTYFAMDGVNSGLIPCAGGTQRLPRLIGTKEALDLIISGDTVAPDYAIDLGLIDELVPDELLLEVSFERALQISNKELKPQRAHFKGIQHTIVNENPIARKKLFNDLRKRVKKDIGSTINAPIMAIEAVEVGMSSFNRGLHVESVYFGELVVNTTSRSLIRTQMALETIRDQSTIVLSTDDVNKIAIVGNSDLSNEVASLSAQAGIRVRLCGNSDSDVGSGLKYCYDFFKEKYESHEIDELDFEQSFDLISATSDYSGIKRADLIIESIDEDLKLKLDTLGEIEPLLLEDSIYLSSSLVFPIAGIASNSAHPERIIGIRMFNHRDRCELMEISVIEDTSIGALSRVLEFAKRLEKTPVVVKGGTGSYTARVELAYFNESLHLVGEGVPVESVDEAMRRLGFEEGPFQTIDKIGLDLVLQASNIIYQVQGDKIKPHPSLGLLVSNERLGVKSGEGFYKYTKGQARLDKSVYKFFPVHSDVQDSVGMREIQERLMLAMVNEALVCLEEEVINSPEEGDIAALLGLGFPATVGGPFNYVDSVGAGEVLKKLHNLSVKYGVRYTSPVLLKNTSVSGDKFYNSL